MPSKDTKDYIWAFKRLKELGIYLGLVVIDSKDIIYNTVRAMFLNARTLLCT